MKFKRAIQMLQGFLSTLGTIIPFKRPLKERMGLKALELFKRIGRKGINHKGVP